MVFVCHYATSKNHQDQLDFSVCVLPCNYIAFLDSFSFAVSIQSDFYFTMMSLAVSFENFTIPLNPSHPNKLHYCASICSQNGNCVAFEYEMPLKCTLMTNITQGSNGIATTVYVRVKGKPGSFLIKTKE